MAIANIEWVEASVGGRLRPDQRTVAIASASLNQYSSKPGGVTKVSALETLTSLNVLESNPPELCAGHGALNSISLTEWTSGLGSWSVGTHDIANPDTFDTPDWAISGTLPDSRKGKAAFVSNIDSGDCWLDDESGALTLDSPPILIPAGTLVPRVSVDHWVATEFGYDGGNIKISVNGGEFNLVPASAIDFSPYNSTLISTIDGNTNPLAGEAAFTGTDSGGLTGSWGQSHLTLFGIAAAQDSIQLRFDFGVDGCDGLIGWYVDDVEVYSCSDELPPSSCGNAVLETGEQCDDGNTFIDDGCSNTCQIDDGWQCDAPIPPGEVPDASFEAGTPNPFWTEASTNFDTPICNEDICGTGTGSGPADGSFWAWFGGIEDFEESSLSQSVVFPSTATQLQFELEVSACDSASDYVELLIDGNREFFIDGSSSLCGLSGYTTQSVDISAYADGGTHDIEFHSENFAVNLDFSNFFIDAISIPGTPSFCSLITTSLTLVKEVITDSGGSATASDWVLNAAGPTPLSGSGPTVSSGSDFAAGSYKLSESGGPVGYDASDWVCIGGTQDNANTITLALGEVATCTISNDDISPTLTVRKTIVNDNGGTIEDPDAFGLQVDDIGVLHNANNAFDAGNHTVSEVGLPGYLPGNWSGDCNTDGTITLTLGQSATCSITNDDTNSTSLTLVKKVINDNGGIAHGSAWTLNAAGPTPFSDIGPTISSGTGFAAGTYKLSESGGPLGYDASDWVCVGGSQDNADTITLALGEAATCTISNDDISPTLTVLKTIINDNGGTIVDPDDFGLKVGNFSVLHGASNNFNAGTHMVSEINLPGYQPGTWSGDCATDGSITLALGQDATCTISNDDIPPTLNLAKVVINNNGGSEPASAWFLSATGPTALFGAGPNVSSGVNFEAGSYNLTESGGPTGYSASDWDCIGGTQVNADTITLTVGEVATCTISNDDISPTLTVLKTIINDNGGTITNPKAFGLKVDGGSVLHGVSNTFDAGNHTVSEDGLPGYQPGFWGGDCNPDGSITLALNQDATCTITNDDTDSTSLTLLKQVINDNGGEATGSAWTLSAAGPTPLSGSGPKVSSSSGFVAGSYKLSESDGPAGYSASDWVCVGGTQDNVDTITLALGEAATCTIKNDDISPTLTVFKTIINDNDGTVEDPNAFGLKVDGGSVLHGTSNTFNAGSHTVSEDGLPDYQPETWSGDCNPDGSITLILNQDATCTITNNDIDPNEVVFGDGFESN